MRRTQQWTTSDERQATIKVKTILKPKTTDTRINHESICSPNLVTGIITKKMRNKPNLTKNGRKLSITKDLQKYLHPALLVSSNNQQSIIDNQLKGPNFTLKASTKHANGADFNPNFYPKFSFSHSLFHSFTRRRRTFLHFYQLSDQNILKSMYIKGLHKYLPWHTLNLSRDTSDKKMQNKPNLHTSSRKCLRNMDLHKYLHPILLL